MTALKPRGAASSAFFLVATSAVWGSLHGGFTEVFSSWERFMGCFFACGVACGAVARAMRVGVKAPALPKPRRKESMDGGSRAMDGGGGDDDDDDDDDGGDDDVANKPRAARGGAATARRRPRRA
ncbi:uncharacterized protein MICPUCDRAFT_38317 [Micromonas pusilla CCMP1545]|uniref:Predicted protein n=1 Tax=Micromonas pusilla (strain CCMP1545) TaxID=564608 RepID=C1MJL5_MICPC|nr:uncharacterized protein MICPUCDRAFT_38317 [Micromonas pusilla CCMP1545]EEH59609.1 predicted protein [Micromonas pusilla CCMP1545]|eukprot:XP_003056233.1 predicted protein [Micromonas pusilla CCMP1545]